VIFVLLLSALPSAAAWLYLRRSMKMRPSSFAASFAAGLLSLALAAVLQAAAFVIAGGAMAGGTAAGALKTALIEEGCRFAALCLLFAVRRLQAEDTEGGPRRAAACGMVAGLSFAAVESASLAAGNPASLIVRLASAVLHAACGMRCAKAAASVRRQKPAFIISLAAAVALHFAYNVMAPRGGLFAVMAVLLAIVSFVSGMR
jgi:RsiW-degrading membrane proteinase PrsW (M82 family)